jgi:hypothetical protein
MNRRVNKTFTNSNQNLKENQIPGQHPPNENALAGHIARKDSAKIGGASSSAAVSHGIEESNQNLMTQTELFRSYAESNKLYLNLTN